MKKMVGIVRTKGLTASCEAELSMYHTCYVPYLGISALASRDLLKGEQSQQPHEQASNDNNMFTFSFIAIDNRLLTIDFRGHF